MKKVLTAIICAILSITACFGISGCSQKSNVIGINQFGTHPSLDNCRLGFLEGLKQSGLVENEDFVIDYQNAEFTPATATQIATSFASKNVRLMCGIATPSSQACLNAAVDYDIPVIFTAVSDPKKASLDSGNVTGTCDVLPIAEQLDLIRAIQPTAKKIGIVYSTGEDNSVSTIATYKQLAPQKGFTIVERGISQQTDVGAAVDYLIAQGVDCFSNMTDNAVVGQLAGFLEKTNAAGIPVYGSEIEQVKQGSLAARGIDYYELGIQTGKMAALIFKGEKKASDIPYEKITEYGYYINTDVAASLGITLQNDVLAAATDCKEAK